MPERQREELPVRSGTAEAPATEQQGARKRTEALRSTLSDWFQHEPTDSTWARDQELRVTAVVQAAASSGNTLKNVDCKTNGCRVTLEHKTQDGRDAMNDLLMDPAFAGARLIVPGDGSDPERSTVIYAFRTGREAEVGAILDTLRQSVEAATAFEP